MTARDGRYDGSSLEEMDVCPEECRAGHPHINARILDMCRLIVHEENPPRL